MNKALKTLLIILSFAVTIQNVSAKELNSDFIKTEMAQAIKADLISKGFTDVDVKVLNVPFQSLSIPDGRLELKILDNQAFSYSKRCVKPLQIVVNNKIIRSFGVPLEITAYKNALVATKVINAGQVINSTNTAIQNVEINSNLKFLVSNKMLNNEMIATKTYRVQENVDRRFIKVRSEVCKNEIVTVFFKTKNTISVSVQAIALTDGVLGDIIAVRNNENKKIYYGKVINRNQVEINI